MPESSTQNSAANSSSSLSRRDLHPPIRYGKWYYAFSAMARTLPPVPNSYKEAIQGPFASQWRAAMVRSLIASLSIRHGALPIFHQEERLFVANGYML